MRAWLVGAGGTTPWAVQPRIAPSGAVLIEGTAQALGLGAQPAGRYMLWIAVGRPEALPDQPPTAPVSAGSTRVLRAEIELARP
ncbi:MAG: hypothetical protein R3F43_10400 [bacterium]